jgi:hypothetical protein
MLLSRNAGSPNLVSIMIHRKHFFFAQVIFFLWWMWKKNILSQIFLVFWKKMNGKKIVKNCHNRFFAYFVQIEGFFFFFFFCQILCCNQASDHPQEDLAKFGCIPNNMKLKFFKESFYIFWPWTSCRYLAISFLNSQIWHTRAIFSLKNPWNVPKSYFSG